MSLAVARLSTATAEEDEFDIAGKHFAAGLRSLQPNQRIFTEKLLSDIMFEAKLQNLNRNSVILADPQYQG